MVAHPVLLRGLTFDAGSGRPMPATDNRPVLVERTDEDFLSAFLVELGTDAGRKLLTQTVRNAGAPDNALRLLQPVHRSFHLAVFEALCDIPGEPRLDAARIDSAGMVVRRFDPRSGLREGWMKRDGEVRGWVDLTDPRALNRDPDPRRRGAAFPAGHPELDARVESAMGALEPYEESFTRLFVAPPHVCAAARRTILYGVVPLASSEFVSNRGAPAQERYSDEDVRRMLAPYFSESVGVSLAGLAGKSFSSRYAEELRGDEALSGAAGADTEKRLEQFATMLRMLVAVFNAFEHPGMRNALNRMSLEFDKPFRRRPLGDALAEAAQVFVNGETDRRFVMPRAWPRMSASDVSNLLRAASDASNRRLAALGSRQGRFDHPDARYEVRGFVRVRRDDGCPPALVWSGTSQPFQIAAWYESGKLPPVQVALPAVTRENVRSFLPNVAFQVPGNIFELLSKNKVKDFLDEKAKEQGGGVDWICGFNIPIITLCAFIVLSIFLSLLNIIFWWLPFIKICIPFPSSRPPLPRPRTP